MEVAYICLCLDLLQFSAQLGNVLLKALAELLDVAVTLSTHLVHHVQQSVDRRSQRLPRPDQHNITCLALLYCATRLHSANCVGYVRLSVRLHANTQIYIVSRRLKVLSKKSR